MDAIVFYNQLRKAGVGLHTCCEGPSTWKLPKPVLLFVNQKANKDYLTELSAKKPTRQDRQRQGRRKERRKGNLRTGPWTIRR